jgi:hypothetical protein
MRLAVVALLLLASPLAASAADKKREPQVTKGESHVSGHFHFIKRDGDRCRIRVGPRDRVAQDADLVIPAGAEVESAFALRGSVVVKRGARVKSAIAAGGSVRVEDGARVTEDAVALSGDVRVEAGGRVEGDAVSLGGRVKIAEGGVVNGDVTSLSLQFAGLDLDGELLEKISAEGKCTVEAE